MFSPSQSSLAAVEQNLIKVVRLDSEIKTQESRRRQMEKDNQDLQQKMEKVPFAVPCCHPFCGRISLSFCSH